MVLTHGKCIDRNGAQMQGAKLLTGAKLLKGAQEKNKLHVGGPGSAGDIPHRGAGVMKQQSAQMQGAKLLTAQSC